MALLRSRYSPNRQLDTAIAELMREIKN